MIFRHYSVTESLGCKCKLKQLTIFFNYTSFWFFWQQSSPFKFGVIQRNSIVFQTYTNWSEPITLQAARVVSAGVDLRLKFLLKCRERRLVADLLR